MNLVRHLPLFALASASLQMYSCAGAEMLAGMNCLSSVLVACILWTFPVLLTTGMLDLTPRHMGWLEYTRLMIVAYLAFLLGIEVALFLTGSNWFMVPLPIAGLVQYRTYRQLRQALSIPAPAATRPAPSVQSRGQSSVLLIVVPPSSFQ